MTLTQQEACYQVIQLVKQNPSLSNLLIKLKNDDFDWVQILRMLGQALEEWSDENGRLPAPGLFGRAACRIKIAVIVCSQGTFYTRAARTDGNSPRS